MGYFTQREKELLARHWPDITWSAKLAAFFVAALILLIHFGVLPMDPFWAQIFGN